MEIITETYELNNISESCHKYFDESTLFFDIECTGLSPKTAFVYLIGCGCRKGSTITLTQFFAKDYSEERDLLEAFEKYIEGFDRLMGFNSTRFDEGFLMARYKKYAIESKMKSKQHIDLYLTVTKAKILLDLQNYKQKTLEVFLGLDREDQYNGGELIPIYNKYSETMDEELKALVLLHNLEDVRGMIFIIDILSYVDLLNAELTNLNFNLCDNLLEFSLNTTVTLPKAITKVRDYGSYVIKDNYVAGSLKAKEAELDTYLDDYKNYYYLLNEDIIIPKVLGESIPKENKRNATKQDCRVKLKSSFIQIPKGIVLDKGVRVFKTDYSSPERYIEVKDVNENIIGSIFKFMLKH